MLEKLYSTLHALLFAIHTRSSSVNEIGERYRLSVWSL